MREGWDDIGDGGSEWIDSTDTIIEGWGGSTPKGDGGTVI